uniref:Uncharacterized protein n=1 Tax=Acrobeloides nanus TaxID=290746 RepID=A0A914C1D7_9BILA
MYKIKGELGQPLFSVAGDEDSIRLAQVFNQWKIDYEQKDPGAIIKFNQLKKMIGKIEKNDTQAYNHLRKPIIKKVATPRKYTPKQKSQKATRRKKLREELRTLGFLANKRKRAKRHVDKTISQSCIKMDENQIEMGTQSYLVDEEPAYYRIENYGSNYVQQVAKQGIAPAYQDPCYSETDSFSHVQSSFQNFSALFSPSSSESGFSDSMHYGVSSECCRSNAPPSSNITLAELNSNHDNCYSPILNYVSYEPKTPEPEPKFVNFDYMNNEYDSGNLHETWLSTDWNYVLNFEDSLP